MKYDLALMNSRVMNLDEIRYVLSQVTLIDKLIYSGVSKEEVKAAIMGCRNNTQLNTWLESVLKKWVAKSYPNPSEWDKKARANAARRNIIRMLENNNLLNASSLKELEEWAESKD